MEQLININGYDITLVTYEQDGEVSEVYAMLDGMELEFAFDIEDMMYKLNNNPLLK